VSPAYSGGGSQPENRRPCSASRGQGGGVEYGVQGAWFVGTQCGEQGSEVVGGGAVLGDEFEGLTVGGE